MLKDSVRFEISLCPDRSHAERTKKERMLPSVYAGIESGFYSRSQCDKTDSSGR